jgi:hypothetical protein
MMRLAAFVGTAALLLAVAAPAAFAAEPTLEHTGRVVMAFGGDLDMPAGEQADVLLVGGGDATVVDGSVNTVVILDGNLILRDATVETVVVVSGSVDLQGSTHVLGDIRSIESAVERSTSAVVDGSIKGIDAELLLLGSFLVPALFLFALGMALATLVAGLVLVAVGSRQVRAAERLIVHEPGSVFVVGLLAAILTPVLAVLAIVTIVGAPLGVAVLLAVLPAIGFLGYLVAAIFLGERILGYDVSRPGVERPYRAALVGIVVLGVIGLVPGLGGLVTAVASLFGLGAVLILAWRTIRGAGTQVSAPMHSPMPMGA